MGKRRDDIKMIANWIENDDSIMADVMLGRKEKTNFSTQSPKYSKRHLRIHEARVADKNAFVCPECNRAWEYMLANSGTGQNKSITLYSKNIVKYKKQRKICNHCRRYG